MRRPNRARGCLILFALIFLILACPNLASLYEGTRFFLLPAFTRASQQIKPVSPNGRYGSLYELARLTNIVRYGYLLRQLDLPNLSVQSIPIPDSPQANILVGFLRADKQPLTIYSAHYDKLYDESNYQAAFDNTAAVSVLLASIEELAGQNNPGARAFLFTSEEERGLRGAAAFVKYIRSNDLSVQQVINFDNLGRGGLAISPPSDNPGYVFTIPLYGEMVYNGRGLARMPPYGPSNERLGRELVCLNPQLTVFSRFTTRGDVNVFSANGIDSVTIAGDDAAFADEVWHTYRDTVDKIDERNLDLAFELIRLDKKCE